MVERVPVTRSGLEKLKAELKELEKKRPALQQAVRTAREHGDLSENAEYHAAKEALAGLEQRINTVRFKIDHAEIIDESKLPDDISTIGSTVVLQDLDSGEEVEYTLVGAGEEDPFEGRILTTSPMGQALLRRKVGDEFEVQVPRGTIRYKVVRLERR